MPVDIWTYREQVFDLDLTGFAVEAADGEVGRVDSVSEDVGEGAIIVDTGPWILGKKVVLPAWLIHSVDAEDGTIHVDRTRDEIKAAPEWDPTGYAEQEYRLMVAEYYSRFYD